MRRRDRMGTPCNLYGTSPRLQADEGRSSDAPQGRTGVRGVRHGRSGAAAPDGVPDLGRLGAGLRHRAGGADPGVRRLAAASSARAGCPPTPGGASSTWPSTSGAGGPAPSCRRRRKPWTGRPAAADLGVPAREALLDALRELPPRQRACVVLRYFEDLSVRETADGARLPRGHGQEPDRARPGRPSRADPHPGSRRRGSTRHEPPEHPAGRGQHRRPARPPRCGGRGRRRPVAGTPPARRRRSRRRRGGRARARRLAGRPRRRQRRPEPGGQSGGAHPGRRGAGRAGARLPGAAGPSRRTPPTRRWTATSCAACCRTAGRSCSATPTAGTGPARSASSERGHHGVVDAPRDVGNYLGATESAVVFGSNTAGLWLLDSSELAWTHVLEAVDFDVNGSAQPVAADPDGHIFLTGSLGTPEETTRPIYRVDLEGGVTELVRGGDVAAYGGRVAWTRHLRRPGGRADHPEPGPKRLVRSWHRRLRREGPRDSRQTGSC